MGQINRVSMTKPSGNHIHTVNIESVK